MQGWRAALVELAGSAPSWMRALASPELHIGGFTDVQLAYPMIDLRSLDDDGTTLRAAVWFCAAVIARGALVARLHCGRAARGSAMAARLRRDFRGSLVRIDDEGLALLRYFDIYPKANEEISDAAGQRALAAMRRALAGEPTNGGGSETLDHGARFR
jgi:hypothetical protein